MHFIHIVLSILISTVLADFDHDIETVQSLFSTEGPTANVLAQFTDLISSIERINPLHNALSQLYFKKLLVQINLGKEKDAIKDLKTTLSIDPSLLPAQHKLMDLLMEYGRFDDEVFDTLNGDKKQDFYHNFNQMITLCETGEFDDCVSLIETNLIPISPLNTTIQQYYVEGLRRSQPPDGQRKIIHALSTLVKVDAVNNLKYFPVLAEYLLFSQVNFDKAFSMVKQCLRYDNEFKPCGDVSKFLSRLQKFLSIVETYSIESSYIYLEDQENPTIDFVDMAQKVDFDYVHQYLNEKPSKRQLAGLSNINNNLEYILHFSNSFDQAEGINNRFFNDIMALVCESFIQRGDFAGSKSACSSTPHNFFPRRVAEIDKLLKRKKFDEAENLMKSFPVNVRQTQLFKSRWEYIEAHHAQRQRQQQQERFRQQQQHQQRYRQQQQRAPPPPPKPKNDYYKVLDIAKDADEKTIKKAHRTQTLKYHPDKYKGKDLTPDEIEGKMQEINQAYEVLSDPEQRRQYDQGNDPNDSTGGFGQPNAGHGFRRQYRTNTGFNFHFDGGDFFNFGGFNKKKKRS